MNFKNTTLNLTMKTYIKIFLASLVITSSLVSQKNQDYEFYLAPVAHADNAYSDSNEKLLQSVEEKIEQLRHELAAFLNLTITIEDFSSIDDAFLTEEYIDSIVSSLPFNQNNSLTIQNAFDTLRSYLSDCVRLHNQLTPLRSRSWAESLITELKKIENNIYTALRILQLELQDPIKTVEDRHENIKISMVDGFIFSQPITLEDKNILSKGMSIVWGHAGGYGTATLLEIEEVTDYLEKNNHLSKMFIFRSLLKALKTIENVTLPHQAHS